MNVYDFCSYLQQYTRKYLYVFQEVLMLRELGV